MLFFQSRMKLSNYKIYIFLVISHLITHHICSQDNGEIYFIGEMRKVMKGGDLTNHINLDTISYTKNTYGLGPLEGLSGELLIIDGKSYRSTLLNDTIQMEETHESKAPFFAYTNANLWNEYPIPDTVVTLKNLENYLLKIIPIENKPFTIKIKGKIAKATFHIVNLPPGVIIHSHDDLIRFKKYFDLVDEEVEIIGFFSTAHQGIFMHHDSFLHLHIITQDRKQMGHLDDLILKNGFAKFYISF